MDSNPRETLERDRDFCLAQAAMLESVNPEVAALFRDKAAKDAAALATEASAIYMPVQPAAASTEPVAA